MNTSNKFEVGDIVRLKRYGKTYFATVTKVGTVRVTVQFTTLGGKAKSLTLSGDEVRYLVQVRG